MAELTTALASLDHGLVEQMAWALVDAQAAGRTVFICGNGGSAAVATHWAADLSKLTALPGQSRLRVMSLTDSAATITAAANDFDYAEIFADQLRTFMSPGDVVIGISTSGRSPNVLRAMEYANQHGADLDRHHRAGRRGAEGAGQPHAGRGLDQRAADRGRGRRGGAPGLPARPRPDRRPGQPPTHGPQRMTLLVTGGAGYIGSVVVERALARGHRIVVIDNLQEGHAAAVPSECRLVQADYGDAAALDAIFAAEAIDAVVHLAAETTVATSVSDPAIYFQNNTVNGVALLEAMRRHGVMRLVFSSTAATYGEPVTVPMTEEHPQRPINAYGESKLMFEQIIRWYHRAYGLKAASFRYFNAAGATEARGEAHRHESHLIPLVLDVAAGDRPSVNVYGTDYPTRDGTCVRDYVHVSDIADAHLLALDALDRLGLDWFNIGTGTGNTRRRSGHGGRAGDRPEGHDGAGAAASRRSGDAGGQLGSHPRGAGLVAADSGARRHHRHRLAVAASAPRRLWRLEPTSACNPDGIRPPRRPAAGAG